MKNFDLQNKQMSVLNQGVNFCKDYVKSGDDLNSSICRNIADITNNYNNDENISEKSKEEIAKYGIDANVKIACNRNMWTGIGLIALSVTSLSIFSILNNRKDT